MSEVKLQSIMCSNCGAPIPDYDPFALTVKCGACTFVNQITHAFSKDIARPERIIPFSVDAYALEASIRKKMEEETYTYEEITEEAEFYAPIAYYVPMYLYEGNYSAYVTAEGCRTPIQGAYSINCVAINDDEDEVPYIANHMAEIYIYEGAKSKEFNPAYFEDREVLRHEPDQEIVWAKYGERSFRVWHRYARNNPGDLSDITMSHKNEGRLIYIPIWYGGYRFKDEDYLYAMDGADESFVIGPNIPIDEDMVEAIDKKRRAWKFATGLRAIGRWSTWLWIGGITLILGAIFKFKFIPATGGYWFWALMFFVIIPLSLSIITWIISKIYKSRYESYERRRLNDAEERKIEGNKQQWESSDEQDDE